MHASGTRALAVCALGAAALAACGGGEVLAIVSFLGSAGGDWVVDDPVAAGFQQRLDCGAAGDEGCFVNIQISGVRSLYATDFAVSYTGNLPGCPSVARTDGTVRAQRISLPGCFSGRYASINEAVSDDGSIRAYFDSEVPDLSTGVWVEIQRGERRFKFTASPLVRDTSDIAGCELTTPTPTPAAGAIAAADRAAGQLQTEITAFTVGGVTWSGRFEGISGMKLTRGGEVLELQRRDLPGAC